MAVKTFEAPIPGTFYRRPSPDKPPFKDIGDAVAVGETIGLIEIMKSFTPVIAEESGKLVAFHIESEESVMAGQPLYPRTDLFLLTPRHGAKNSFRLPISGFLLLPGENWKPRQAIV